MGNSHTIVKHSIYSPKTSEYVVWEPEQIKSADPVTYDDGNVIPLSKRFDRSSNDIRYSLISTDKNGKYNNSQDTRAYYQIPFSESIQRVVDPNYKGRDHIFVSETPEVLQKIGFEKLPIMMPLRKLRLNYYNDRDFKNKFGKLRPSENTHGLYGNLSKITNAIKDPIAVIGNFAESAHENSVVVLTDINIRGTKVIVPVIIESEAKTESNMIDSHIILTVYDKSDWLNNLVKPAIKEENKGNVGIFYLNKKKAENYTAFSQLKGNVDSAFIHNITDSGSPVNDKFDDGQFSYHCKTNHWFAVFVYYFGAVIDGICYF